MSSDFLRKIGEILRSGKAIEERLRLATQELGTFVPGGVATVYLYDRESEDFYLKSTTLKLPPSTTSFQYQGTGTVEELALKEKRAVALSEARRPDGSRLRAEIQVHPLVSADDPLGILLLQSVSEQGIPLALVEEISEAVGLLSDALRASLREESTALRMTKIAAINEAGINIISTLDLSRLLKLVATSGCLIMESETCVIRLLDAQTGKYGIREFYGMKEGGDQKDLFRLDKQAATLVLKGAPSVLVKDVAEEEEWREFAGVARTLICFPLRGDGEILGTITIFDKFPHKTFYPSSFNADDAATFEKYIRYVEKAISNAITFEKSERLKNLDEATGLPTLSYFQARLLHELARAKRFKRRLVLMICEVTPRIPDAGFSSIDRGSWVVKRLSRVIRETLREYDIVARISEWKFAMILPEAEDGRVSAIPRIKTAIQGEIEDIR